jgi:hypothetical protein
MAYNLVNDFYGLTQNQTLVGADLITTNPSWVLAVYRFRQAVTFSRNTMTSANDDPSSGIIVQGGPLIITSDCTALQIESNKSSYIGGLTATLTFGEVNYLSEILPTDWILAWIVNDGERATDLVSRIKAGTPCNAFHDGLKFVGRVGSIRKILSVADTGMKTIGYTLQAKSFREFDMTVFYDQQLRFAIPNIGAYIGLLGQNLMELMSVTIEKGGIDINTVLPWLINLLLGSGIADGFVNPLGKVISKGAKGLNQPIAHGLTSDEDAPYAYILPNEVGRLLDKKATSKKGALLSYADILETMIGIQKYSGGFTSSIGSSSPQAMFQPDGLITKGNRRNTNTPLTGAFPAITPDFTNKSVWTILSQFLNPVINEMYTTLRINEQGLVVPQLIFRQIPFTTNVFANGHGAANQIQTTPFLTLPRWKIDPLLLKSFNIGRSDTEQFNFFHVYGTSDLLKKDSLVQQLIRLPPIQDFTDIKRNGIATFQATVAVAPQTVLTGATGNWNMLTADWHSGGHLKFNGTINVIGIQAPICIGDNVEFDNLVMHIESVLHSCQISQDGRKTFTTTLLVTQGVRGDADAQAAALVPAKTNVAGPPTRNQAAEDGRTIYAGIYRKDQNDFDPGLTYEGQNTSSPKTSRADLAPVSTPDQNADAASDFNKAS